VPYAFVQLDIRIPTTTTIAAIITAITAMLFASSDNTDADHDLLDARLVHGWLHAAVCGVQSTE